MTQNLETITIFGASLKLQPIDKDIVKSIFAGAHASFNFYAAEFHGQQFVLLQSKSSKKMPPSHMTFFSQRISERLNAPVVFLLEGLKTIERDRLVHKGIYFVVSGKYAYLPFLIANRLSSNTEAATQLTPVAQYILLYHLQVSSIDNLTAKDLAVFLPYPYLAITRAVKVLLDCGVVSVEADGKSKRIKLNGNKEQIWNKCLPLLKSPIKKVYFIDGTLDKEYKLCSINALSIYTHLNPGQRKMYALTETEFRDLKDLPMYDLEGDIRIEVWTYPPIAVNKRAADPLSLYLTLRDDQDPRVEKELDYLLKELWSKD